MKLGDAVQVDTGELCKDLTADLLSYGTGKSRESFRELLNEQSEPSLGLALEADMPLQPLQDECGGSRASHAQDMAGSGLLAAPQQPERADAAAAVQDPGLLAVPEQSQPGEAAAAVQEYDARWFPNAFKISGMKHVCDNLLHQVLSSLPFWDTLLIKLQSLECLLSQVTWRERFVATCMQHASLEDKNTILQWSSEKLAGLRWQVICKFTKDAASLQSKPNTLLFVVTFGLGLNMEQTIDKQRVDLREW